MTVFLFRIGLFRFRSGSARSRSPSSFSETVSPFRMRSLSRSYQAVRMTADSCIRSSFVMRSAASRIAVAAIKRSAGSPGKTDGSSAALVATAGLSGSRSTRGSSRASCIHCKAGRSRLMRPRAASVATSRQQIAGMPILLARSISRRASRPNRAGLLTHQIQACVSRTINVRHPRCRLSDRRYRREQ